MEKLRIMLAEDHQTVREGIKLLINSQPDMEVIGEADNGNAVITKARKMSPDIIILDISMPEMNGLKTTKKLKHSFPAVKILTLTRHTDDAYIQQMIEAGSDGYILKQSAPTELIRAIHSVAEGNNYLDPAITNKVMGSYLDRSTRLRGERKAEPTEREAEVLRMIASGYTNKEIAERMRISVKTVEAHRYNAMTKMDMRSRIDIVRYAVLQGWLEDL